MELLCTDNLVFIAKSVVKLRQETRDVEAKPRLESSQNLAKTKVLSSGNATVHKRMLS